jgi:hypothetical protein
MDAIKPLPVNSLVMEYFPTTPPRGLASSLAPFFRGYQAMRDQLMAILTDEDLGYRIGGANPSLGALCREIGEIERAYTDSFRTFAQDFGYRNTDPRLETSVVALSAWYAELDLQLKEVIMGLSEEDAANRSVDRRDFPGFAPLPRVQMDLYKEALLIFYSKVSVYLRSLGKTLPQQWQEWIG